MDVDASGDDDDERSYIVKTDHNITFTGEAEQLAALWLHIKLKKLLDSDVRKQRVCCAYTASLFRGKALDWFARTLPTNKLLLSDFKTLKALVKEVFGKSKDVTTARAQMKITSNKPKTSPKKIEALVQVAKGTSNSSGTTRKANRRKGNKSKTKCTKCGRTNHATADCYAKTTVNIISITGDQTEEDSGLDYSRITGLKIQGQLLAALVDTGSEINCIRECVVRDAPVSTKRNNNAANGTSMVQNAKYIIETIDGTIQKASYSVLRFSHLGRAARFTSNFRVAGMSVCNETRSFADCQQTSHL